MHVGILDTILLFKSRFLAGCILLLIGFVLISMVCISCSLARNMRTKRKETTIEKRNIEQPSSPSPVRAQV